MHMKKCMTVHALLGNIRPRFRYSKDADSLELPGGEPPGPPPGPNNGTAGWGGVVVPPSHLNVFHNDKQSLHVVPMA